MSSILTNNSAMVALQTMKKINSNMAMTQSEISTGKLVATAKDNAAVWAISKVMESDVKGFKGISHSLNLGSSTVKLVLCPRWRREIARQHNRAPVHQLHDQIAALLFVRHH